MAVEVVLQMTRQTKVILIMVVLAVAVAVELVSPQVLVD